MQLVPVPLQHGGKWEAPFLNSLRGSSRGLNERLLMVMCHHTRSPHPLQVAPKPCKIQEIFCFEGPDLSWLQLEEILLPEGIIRKLSWNSRGTHFPFTVVFPCNLEGYSLKILFTSHCSRRWRDSCHSFCDCQEWKQWNEGYHGVSFHLKKNKKKKRERKPDHFFLLVKPRSPQVIIVARSIAILWCKVMHLPSIMG